MNASKNFMGKLDNTLGLMDNVSITENGATGFRSTGHALLDLNFSVSSLRGTDEETIIDKWKRAFVENPYLAMRWLFFLRDVREGLGERRTFRIIVRYMANDCTLMHKLINKSDAFCKYTEIDELIPYYGRWDDLVDLLQVKAIRNVVMKAIVKQFRKDWASYNKGESISLLAKWLPSLTAGNKKSRLMAKRIASKIGIKETEYRHRLTKMRSVLNVTEQLMSRQKWGEIDYSTVPSKANLIYSDAFMRHDMERRLAFLRSVKTGEEKINSSVTYPYEILYRLRRSLDYGVGDNETLEMMWKNLPNNESDSRTIVVADSSGSMMFGTVANSEATAWDVAHSLAIYFAEKLRGEFHNQYITFSERPQYVNLNGCDTLKEKLAVALNHSEITNTNVEAVFDLILQTAIRYDMTQDDIPENILIISDMEFDKCAVSNRCGTNLSLTLFESISKKYEEHGFKLPRIVFWNVCSRTLTIPMRNNELGVCLVSGFSPNIADMVLSGETDPYKCLVNKLMEKRYDPISLAFNMD